MKQKIIVKVQMNCGKCRTKAMKIAAVAEGVISVSIEGDEKDRVVVIGDGVDSAGLTHCLRKKVGYATLLSVEEVKPKVDDKQIEGEKEKKIEEEKKKPEADPWSNIRCCQYPEVYITRMEYPDQQPICSIM